MGLSENLKTLRHNNNWSQREVAEMLDIKTTRYQAWEENRAEPQICMLIKLAKLYKITVDELISDGEDK